jgi:hypothetical protein
MSRIALCVLLLAGCGAAVDAPRASLCRAAAPAVSWRAPHVVLVTVDGVRWQDVFNAEMSERLPNLAALARRGIALGRPGDEPFEASGPNFVSLPGYREIISGHPTVGCTNNDCPATTDVTLLDELRAAGLPPSDVAAIGSWERLERAAAASPEDLAVSFGRHAGASRDRMRVSPRAAALLEAAEDADAAPGHHDYRPDALTAALALEYARVVHPRFLWVGLGDTDEHAHKGEYAEYLESLHRADAVVGELVRTLGDDTIVIVTTDHGRAANFRDHGGFAPESQAVWLVAAGPGLSAAEREARGLPSPRRLSGIAHLILESIGRSTHASMIASQ